MPDLPPATLEQISQSNLPVTHKSAIRRFYERATGTMLSPFASQGMGHVREGAAVVREGGEALVVGGVLGMVDAEFNGLDFGSNKNIPIDGILAALGLGGAVVLANDPLGIAPDLRHAGSQALAILTYRKTKAWREKSLTSSTVPPTTVAGEDPLLTAAKNL